MAPRVGAVRPPAPRRARGRRPLRRDARQPRQQLVRGGGLGAGGGGGGVAARGVRGAGPGLGAVQVRGHVSGPRVTCRVAAGCSSSGCGGWGRGRRCWWTTCCRRWAGSRCSATAGAGRSGGPPCWRRPTPSEPRPAPPRPCNCPLQAAGLVRGAGLRQPGGRAGGLHGRGQRAARAGAGGGRGDQPAAVHQARAGGGSHVSRVAHVSCNVARVSCGPSRWCAARCGARGRGSR